METHWTAYLTALSTPVIAMLGAWIGWRQWVTTRDKLRLELFERRMEVHKALYETLGCLYVKGRLSSEEELRYLTGTSGAKWLFGKEINEYLLKELWPKLADHQRYVEELKDVADDLEARKRLAEAKAENWKWLRAQDSRIDALFMPYLQFKDRI